MANEKLIDLARLAFRGRSRPSTSTPTWSEIDGALSALADGIERAGYSCRDGEDAELILPWEMVEKIAQEIGAPLLYDSDGRAFLGSFHGIDISTFKVEAIRERP